MNPIYGRAKRGKRVYQETAGKRTKKENVIAGYCNGIILALTIFTWSCKTEWFLMWLEYSLIPLLKPGSVIVLDNASFHSKKFVPIIAETYGLKVLWLPRYSPDKNKIEKRWATLKKWLRNYSKQYDNIRLAIMGHFG